jgi:tetratricopeptide (TPR) repeat protein
MGSFMTSARPGNRYLLCWVALVLAVVACYAPALGGPFVYDDTSLIRDNARLNGLSQAPHWFGTMLLGEEESSRYYRPLLLAALAADRAVWGENTSGYHAMNIAWHLCNTLLVGLLLLRLGWNRWAAWLASALFALHPLHAQAVAYMSGRGDVQSMGLGLLAIHAAMSAWSPGRRRHSWIWNVAAALLFAASILTREMGALAIIWLALVAWLLKVRRDRWVSTMAALAAAAVVVLALRLQAADPAPTQERIPFPPVLVGLLVFRALGFYAVHLAAPIVLAFDRSLIPPTPLHHVYLALGLAILAAAAWCAVRFHRSGDRPALFCLLWTFISFLPVSNLIRLSATASDQWAYAPSIGLFAGAALLASRAWLQLGRESRRLLAGLLALTLLAWGVRLFARSMDYSSGLALYSANVEQGVVSTRILNNLGLELARADRKEEAIQRFEESLRLDPRNLSARANRAMVICAMGKRDEAKAELQKLTREHPGYEQGWVALMLLHHDEPAAMKAIGETALKTGKQFPKVRTLMREDGPKSSGAQSDRIH